MTAVSRSILDTVIKLYYPAVYMFLEAIDLLLVCDSFTPASFLLRRPSFLRRTSTSLSFCRIDIDAGDHAAVARRTAAALQLRGAAVCTKQIRRAPGTKIQKYSTAVYTIQY